MSCCFILSPSSPPYVANSLHKVSIHSSEAAGKHLNCFSFSLSLWISCVRSTWHKELHHMYDLHLQHSFLNYIITRWHWDDIEMATISKDPAVTTSKFETLTFGEQTRIWYATHLLIVVKNHAKFHPSTMNGLGSTI